MSQSTGSAAGQTTSDADGATPDLHQQISTFYGQTVQHTDDLIFDACCVADYDPALLEAIPEEVKDRRYGCGSPIPAALQGAHVLDLGSGAGIDCFIAAQLVGPSGRVVGLDMTPEQLQVARRNIAPVMAQIGLSKPNVEFIEGRIEAIPLEDASFDVVLSNCVINLSPDKERVFSEIRRVLRPGGEFYIADIVADRRIPAAVQQDARSYAECLAGAAYGGDLRRTMQRAGFNDVRSVRTRRLDDLIDGIHFDSVVLRGFNLPLEDACEDYGQVAVYLGTINGHAASFTLDAGHVFEAGKAERVCKNTADMLQGSRYATHFHVSEPIFHMGLFACGPASPGGETPSSAACC